MEERLQLVDQSWKKRKRMELEEKSHDHHHHHDLISELPESMIPTIMSFLSMEDAIRFSYASKKFFSSAFKSIPILDFDFFSFKKNSNKRFGSASSFHNFVAKSLQLLRNSTGDDTCCSQRLSFVGPISNILVYKMVDFSLNNKIKELNLNGDFDKTAICNLPNTLFSAKHLASLKIKGFYLEELKEDQSLVLGCQLIEDISLSFCSGFKTITLFGDKLKHVVLDSCPQLMKINIDPRVSLESFSYSSAVFDKQLEEQQQSNYCEILFAFESFKLLRFLEFKNTTIITDEWFQDHVSGLSLLETLRLDNCSRLKNICISSHILKTLELSKCEQLETIYIIAAPKLESFLFDNMGKENHCKVINISSSGKYLKSLVLGGASVSDKWIGDNLSRFLYLEHLELKGCNLLKNIEFCAGKLTSLKLLTCTNLSKIEIEAPNLVSFMYNGNLLPSHPVLISSSRLHATVSLSNTQFYMKNHSRRFRDFIGSFDHCERLILVNISAGVLIFNKLIRMDMIPPLFDLKHLKVELKWNGIRRIVELVEGLLWLVPHPETISMILHDLDGKVLKSLNLKFHYKPAVNEEDNMSCCTLYPIKCWRHFLVGVEMDNFEDSCERSSVQNFLIENAMGLINVICNTY